MEKKWFKSSVKIVPPKSWVACRLLRFIFLVIDTLFHLADLSASQKGVLIRVQATDDKEAEEIEKKVIKLLVKK